MMALPTRIAWLDRLGATASALCALHCAAVPFLFLWMPAFAIALRSWSDPHHGLAMMLWATLRWERSMVAIVLAFATLVLLAGYARHRDPRVLLPGVLGAALLVTAVTVGFDQPLWVHTTLMVAGGILLSVAHLTNLRATRRLPSISHALRS
jgi:hypothetical protein